MRNLIFSLIMIFVLIGCGSATDDGSSGGGTNGSTSAVFNNAEDFMQFVVDDADTGTLVIDLENEDLQPYTESGCLFLAIEGTDMDSRGGVSSASTHTVFDPDISNTAMDSGVDDGDDLAEVEIRDSYFSFDETIDFYLYHDDTLLAHITYN